MEWEHHPVARLCVALGALKPIKEILEMNTTKYVFGLAAAATVALGTSGASAQSSDPVSRESVKAETKASGSLAPAGQGPGANESGNTGRSTKTRAQRKGETVMERDMGGLTPAGVGGVKPEADDV